MQHFPFSILCVTNLTVGNDENIVPISSPENMQNLLAFSTKFSLTFLVNLVMFAVWEEEPLRIATTSPFEQIGLMVTKKRCPVGFNYTE